ncbi:MAG: 3-methyl-2-oxobutanoate hydroxymethyltransferase [Planctomycetes bacterium]|nr:3-methyl-2-oxobutanoate hydroxymethyltransferase [Planctomycetota bacterium]MCB9936263.1 3-methyl-2-oxobutanoate hydroxymethyltransferase [Planctomycetota bacterium]
MPKRTTIRDIQNKANDGQKISMVTAYDAFSAKLVEQAGIDIALVGDSVGTTLQGRNDTLGVSMQDMLYHTEIVARSTERVLVIGDMPFGSYQVNEDQAMQNAVAFLKAGANAVKLEGGASVMPIIERMCEAGIPVMGHLGFTPQSTNITSGPRVNKSRDELMEDAESLADAGVFALVLEMVPGKIAQEITKATSVPTIGIGAGPHTNGQVLVFHDMLGFSPEFSPKFLKRYLDFHQQALSALKQYKQEVEGGTFPGEEHSY